MLRDAALLTVVSHQSLAAVRFPTELEHERLIEWRTVTMKQFLRNWLVVRALYELARFDILHGVFKIASTSERLTRQTFTVAPTGVQYDHAIGDAVVLATCFYWKPVRCLQRSVCLVRLLRTRGIAARLVIGYRPTPFFSHAWVEVNGRVVNDSPVYQRRLRILHVA
jgi:hypothetical protein